MSLLGKIGHAVGDIVHDVEKLGEGGLHFLEGAGKAVLGTAEDIAKGAFGVVKAAVGLIAFRPLRAKEVALAQRVFGSSIQLDRVLICSLSGFGGRPFTVPGAEVALIATYIPGIGGLVFVAALLAHATDKYIIFAGRDAYKDGINWDSKKTPGARLIHELTHVWQGNYHIFAPTTHWQISAVAASRINRRAGRTVTLPAGIGVTTPQNSKPPSSKVGTSMLSERRARLAILPESPTSPATSGPANRVPLRSSFRKARNC